MKQVHFIVQGKGGVGKSLIAAILAQYFIAQSGAMTHFFDTDPINQTFSRYKALNVTTLNIVGTNNAIDHSKFDALIEDIINQDGIAIVDNGSTTFLPLMQYIKENSVLELLNENGVATIFHIPLQGGGGLSDTVEGLATILKVFSVPVVVWLNNHQGDILIAGKRFQEVKIYRENADKILGVCEIKKYQSDLYALAIQQMTENHLTIEEIKQDATWRLMSKQRVKIFYQEIVEQLQNIPLLNTEFQAA